MKIIVTGSLGNIGKPLATDLVQQGHTVVVISSKAEKQKDIEAIGATAAIGSLDDVDFLTNTFNGADAVFAMVPPNFGVTDSRAYYKQLGNTYATAIKQAGVKRLVHLSSIGAHLDSGTGFILGAHDVEGIFNSGLTDVNITHLRPAYFYTNLLNFAGMVKAAGFIGANYGDDDSIVMVHPKDIATVAAEELVNPVSENRIRYIASDERTANETAGILGEAIGKPDLKWNTLTNEQMAQGMKQQGMPDAVIDNFVEMGESVHTGKVSEDYLTHKPQIMGSNKIEEFAKEFAAAYNG